MKSIWMKQALQDCHDLHRYCCDCAESLPIEIVAGLKQIEGIKDIKVEVTWSPAWKITRISRYGRLPLDYHLVKQANHF